MSTPAEDRGAVETRNHTDEGSRPASDAEQPNQADPVEVDSAGGSQAPHTDRLGDGSPAVEPRRPSGNDPS